MPTITTKLELITELSKDLDQMVAKQTDELVVEALLAKAIKFILEGEYLENLLDDLLNNNDLLDKLHDDPAAMAIVRIIPLEFVD